MGQLEQSHAETFGFTPCHLPTPSPPPLCSTALQDFGEQGTSTETRQKIPDRQTISA